MADETRFLNQRPTINYSLPSIYSVPDALNELSSRARYRMKQLGERYDPIEMSPDMLMEEMAGHWPGPGVEPMSPADRMNALAAEVMPAGMALKLRGIAKHRPYYHGTGNEETYDAILDGGFTRGHSAELNRAGTSLSEDPLVSNRYEFSGENLANLLAVDVKTPASEVYNLSPSLYGSGHVPDEPFAVYRKPNMMYQEAETFGLRPRNRYYDEWEKEYGPLPPLNPETGGVGEEVFEFMERADKATDDAQARYKAAASGGASPDELKAIQDDINWHNDDYTSWMDTGMPALPRGTKEQTSEQFLPRPLNSNERMLVDNSVAAESRLKDASSGVMDRLKENGPPTRREMADYIGAIGAIKSNKGAYAQNMQSIVADLASQFDIDKRGSMFGGRRAYSPMAEGIRAHLGSSGSIEKVKADVQWLENASRDIRWASNQLRPNGSQTPQAAKRMEKLGGERGLNKLYSEYHKRLESFGDYLESHMPVGPARNSGFLDSPLLEH